MNLLEKTAVLTGGGSGIGLGIAHGLAAVGCRVAIAGRREAPLRQAAEEWVGEPALSYHTVDVTDRDAVSQLFDWANDRLGKVDILVNSAGTNIATRTMSEMTPQQWDQMMAANATGAYNCMYAVLPQMRARRDGLIINISSIAGKRASSLAGIAYSASKFAMTALGSAVGQEEAPNGIRITNIYPGEVNTSLLDRRPNPVSDKHKAAILQPEDIGPLVVAIAALPARAHVPEIVIKPTMQEYA